MDEVKTEASVSQLINQLVETDRNELISLYRKTLQEMLFTNRSDIHPRMVGQVAEQEADAFVRFLTLPTFSGNEHGSWLSETGLSPQSMLRLGRTTRQFFITHAVGTLLLDALRIVDEYEEAVAQGFIQSREENILGEQERIRGALQVAIGRYTIEIKEVQMIAEKATEANEFKSRFIARISHELRTPLGALMGMAEMLQENIYGPLNEAQKNLVNRILNNANTLKNTFSELLDQSQIELGRLRLKEETFSPKDVVETVYSNYLSMALKKGLSLHIGIAPNAPEMVTGDKVRTEQILTNLVVNAIKFTNAGGVIIYLESQGDAHWVLKVKDSGTGISKEDMTLIFEPFRQVDETASRKYGGVGLGLSIVLQLVKAMKGTIDVESKVGQGSTFIVTLPAQSSQSSIRGT